MNMVSQPEGAGEHTLTPDPDWWRGAVIYQIYPRSFQDSNGDGIGDLAGIRQRLPYIASLGVDAIWISPFFTSPMKDFGYDITDYRGVDPMFGTLSDFDALLAEAHAHGLRIMIDLVLSHTSDQHPWFIESRSDAANDKADWFIWADARLDGTPPNNWLSIFGGSAWEWDASRQQYYMHNFLAAQPDLNFHNTDVQEALLDVARFWLDRGVDGFRLDTINFYYCDKALRDNPALPVAHRNDSIAPSVNPYNFQDHRYDKSQPENIGFLKRMRALMEEYRDIAAVGEVGDAQQGLKLVADYTADNDKMQMCYSFDFLSSNKLTVAGIRSVVAEFEKAAPDGWSCWAFSNHDVERHASRFAGSVSDQDRFLKLLISLLLSLRGSSCIYQGEELGLGEAQVAYEDLQDPYGLRFWPKFKGRDGCRTPMVWDTQSEFAGFSNVKPWLPVAKEHHVNAVDRQDGDGASVLNHYRQFLTFRKSQPVLVKGGIEFLEDHPSVLAFRRMHQGAALFCAFNTSGVEQTVSVPDSVKSTLQTGCDFDADLSDGKLTLGPYAAFFGQMAL